MKKKLTVNQRRNRFWLINAFLFHILKLNPFRKKNIWIFGCWEGQKYDDNARYLFEYVNENHKDIIPIWFTKKQEIYDELKKKGYRVELFGTKSAYLSQLRAGVAFHTNGMDDLGNICMFSGAKIIALWHGMIIKRSYYTRFRHSGLHYILKRIKDTIYNATYTDYAAVTSEYALKNLCATLHLNERQGLLTGLPRNDAFKKNLLKKDVIKREDVSDENKIILYMPTHREYDNSPIEETVKLLDQNKDLNSFLQKNNANILFKPHYLTKIDYMPTSEHIKVITQEEITSTQELLAVSDVLITDYSSCIIDYATTEKPTILFTKDLNRYIDYLGLLPPWEEIYKEIMITDNELFLSRIKKAIGNPENCLETTNIFNKYYQDEELKKSVSYSKNVFDATKDILRKRRNSYGRH